MSERADFGVPVIVTATPEHEIRRYADWVEPPAPGDWDLDLGEAGGD